MRPTVTFDNLPEFVVIRGEIYHVNYGYRAAMRIEIEMFRDDISDEQKLLNALNIFYFENIPKDVRKAVDYMLWFHRCGEEVKSGGSSGNAKRGYCFQQDAPLIYAAFRQQYGIDLRRTMNAELHWWEFSALFESLNEDTKMSKVIYWRTCRLGDLSKSERKHVQKMRAMYALKVSDGNMDSATKLAQRNARWIDHVRRRAECLRK